MTYQTEQPRKSQNEEKVRALHKGLREGIQDRLAGHNHETLAKLLKKAIVIETESAKKAKPTAPKPAKDDKGNSRGQTPKTGVNRGKMGRRIEALQDQWD